MVTALFQLNHSLAIEALLPTCVLCYLQELGGAWVGRAMLGLVPFVVAYTTYPSVTFSTCSTGAAITVMTMILWPDPFSTFGSRAVVTVPSGKYGKLFVPVSFEAIVK
jgi:hypothetical protein